MLYIGIDVHKKNLQVCIMDEQAQVLRQCRVANDQQSMVLFFESLPGAAVALEASHNWGMLYDVLSLLGLDVHICDAREARLIGLNRVKTDKNDAYRLAALLRAGFLPECYVPTGDCRELRDLVRARAAAKRASIGIKNQIHAILSRNWIKHQYSDLFGKAGREFLGSLQLRECTRLLIDSKLRMLDCAESEVRALALEVARHARLDKRAMLLMTMPGVGELTALIILAEIGDISRFSRAESLVNFAGLHPGEDSSGERTRRSRITKEGSRWLRWILVEAALHTVRQQGKIRDLYVRISQKKGHNKAIVAAAREMLVSIYWMLRRMEPYRPSGRSEPLQLAGEAR